MKTASVVSEKQTEPSPVVKNLAIRHHRNELPNAGFARSVSRQVIISSLLLRQLADINSSANTLLFEEV